MTENEMIIISIEEFSRLQTYMLAADKESESYKLMHDRYIELKVILTTFGINIVELNKILIPQNESVIRQNDPVGFFVPPDSPTQRWKMPLHHPAGLGFLPRHPSVP